MEPNSNEQSSGTENPARDDIPPLLRAIWDWDAQAIAGAIAKGADPNATCHGSTMIHFAVRDANEMALTALIGAGAKVQPDALKVLGEPEITDWMLDDHNEPSYARIAQLLLDHGASPHVTAYNGNQLFTTFPADGCPNLHRVLSTAVSALEPRVTRITLGVTDFPRAFRFYRDGLGWPTPFSEDNYFAIFNTVGTRLSLCPIDRLSADLGPEIQPAGAAFRGITLSHNVRTKEEVPATLAAAERAGGRIIKEARDVSWRVCTGYFCDPEGYCWEVTWNPYQPLDDNGFMNLNP